MTKLDPMITSYGDLAIKSCLRYHKLHWKQVKNVVIQKKVLFFPQFSFLSSSFSFYQSRSSICRWLNIFWELHRATFSGMCHIVLTSLLYVTLISADIQTMTLQGQSIRNIDVIYLFQQFHFNYTSIHVYTYEIKFLINDAQKHFYTES